MKIKTSRATYWNKVWQLSTKENFKVTTGGDVVAYLNDIPVIIDDSLPENIISLEE